MKENSLFYFCDNIGSVFDSQVLALVTHIISRNYFNKVYLFLGIRDEAEKEKVLNKNISPDLQIVFYKTYANYPIFNFLIRRSLRSVIKEQSVVLSKVIFHSRGELTVWHLSKVLDKKYHKNILPDVRGASVEEAEEYLDSNTFIKFLKVSNYRNATKNLSFFQRISVVSDSLKNYLQNKYKIDAKYLFITPCLAGSDFRFDESQRKQIRKELNLNDDQLLIVFSTGGTANWQNNDMLPILAEKGLKVLNLSKKEIKHKNIINRFVSYSQIPSYLNASDAAIIWRDKSTVNKVASPVKFSEYICCGLPVIANNSVDMINNFLTHYDFGIITENMESVDLLTIKNLLKINRKRISDIGIENFGIDLIVNKYLFIYSSLNHL